MKKIIDFIFGKKHEYVILIEAKEKFFSIFDQTGLKETHVKTVYSDSGKRIYKCYICGKKIEATIDKNGIERIKNTRDCK